MHYTPRHRFELGSSIARRQVLSVMGCTKAAAGGHFDVSNAFETSKWPKSVAFVHAITGSAPRRTILDPAPKRLRFHRWSHFLLCNNTPTKITYWGVICCNGVTETGTRTARHTQYSTTPLHNLFYKRSTHYCITSPAIALMWGLVSLGGRTPCDGMHEGN